MQGKTAGMHAVLEASLREHSNSLQSALDASVAAKAQLELDLAANEKAKAKLAKELDASEAAKAKLAKELDASEAAKAKMEKDYLDAMERIAGMSATIVETADD